MWLQIRGCERGVSQGHPGFVLVLASDMLCIRSKKLARSTLQLGMLRCRIH